MENNLKVIKGNNDIVPSPIISLATGFSIVENIKLMEELIMDLMQTMHQKDHDSDMDEFQELLKRSPRHYKVLRKILADNNYVKRKLKDDFLEESRHGKRRINSEYNED